MAKFMCQQSGNVFEFNLEHDIKTMRTHSAYTEVVEATKEVVATEVVKPNKKVKQDETSISRGSINT